MTQTSKEVRATAARHAEIAAEERFDAAIAASASRLERLADEALAEHRASRTESLDAAP